MKTSQKRAIYYAYAKKKASYTKRVLEVCDLNNIWVDISVYDGVTLRRCRDALWELKKSLGWDWNKFYEFFRNI